MNYRCDACGCYLDPGEGRRCEDCRRRIDQRAARIERMRAAIRLTDGGQYQIKTEEMAYESVRN